jgi:uncharacterized SAM-binding protein YcdF (DUF218 family)
LNYLIDYLKGQFNSLNIFLFILIVGLLLLWLKRRRSGVVCLTIATVFFFLVSTAYLPRYLIADIEAQYRPLNDVHLKTLKGKVVIHVLGGGYTYDDKLPPNQQLSMVSLGRLTEGIRLHNKIDESVLVCSGYKASGTEALAAVMRKTAIDLGVKPGSIDTLSHAHTTQEEALHLREKYAQIVNVIIVTDAIHMPRAYKFFREQGFSPLAAPTNYLTKTEETGLSIGFLPSVENMHLMDRVLREFFANIKALVS